MLALLVVGALVSGSFVGWRAGMLDPWLGLERAASGALLEPAPTAVPDDVGGLDADPVAVDLDPGAAVPPRPAALRRALTPQLSAPALGQHVLVEVAPLVGSQPYFTRGTGLATPASTTKLVTATAALLALGPDHRFTTSVVAEAGRRGVPRIVLVGGGDPYLMRTPRQPDGSPWPYPVRADLRSLAIDTADGLRENGVRRVSVGYDTSLFSGPAINPDWEPDYVPDAVVSPITSLWVDQGRPPGRSGRVNDPAADAAASFVDSLRQAGVTVTGTPVETRASDDAQPVAAIAGATLGAVVERILDVSDNEGAEVLLRQVGLASQGVGSTVAGKRGVRSLLGAAGVRLGATTFYDGSGLSRRSVASPASLVDVLQLAAAPGRPELRHVLSGLPVAGFTGSLSVRMADGPPVALGRVRAKTGTLRGVSSLAGLAVDLEGNVLVFALMADQIDEDLKFLAQEALDSAAAELGACGCS
ncbi:MAG: D-alanyl-D-alanine carboxypeptidase/D-alanyl-D-alanine-endopeptidase [Nocardioides sp.]